MPTPVLGLDLDGVVANYLDALRHHFADTRGTPLEHLPTPTVWSLADAGWGFTDEADWADTHAAAVDRGLYATMPALPGAAAALTRLTADGVRIRIITARLTHPDQKRRAVTDTAAWLDTAHIPYDDLCFVDDKPSIRADLYIEDAPHVIGALHRHNRAVLIADAPYNRHLAGPRAHTWPDLEQQTRTLLHLPGSRHLTSTPPPHPGNPDE